MKTKLKLIISALLFVSTFAMGSYFAGEPDRTKTTIEAFPQIVITGTTSKIIINLKDSSGKPIFDADESKWSINHTGPSVVGTPSPTGGLGEYRFEVEYNNNTNEDVSDTYTITVKGVELNPITVTFKKTGIDITYGVPQKDNSSISIDKNTIIANNSDFATVTIKVRDDENRPVQDPTLSITLKDTFKDTDLEADAIFTLISSNTQQAIFTYSVKSSIIEEGVEIRAVIEGKDSDEVPGEAITLGPVEVEFLPTPLPSCLKLEAGKIGYIASIFDNDYVPYSPATGPANINVTDADGAIDNLVDVQGTLHHSGKIVSIPYTGCISNVPSYTSVYVVKAENTEDGVAKRVYMSYTRQSARNGAIQAKISTKIGEELPAKKLDINNGIGDGSDKIVINSLSNQKKSVYGLRLANFKIAVNSSSATGEIQLRDIVGIPDRMFGKADNNERTDTHMFLYMPVTNSTTGKTWLNNNLGADYTNLNSTSFNLLQQAKSSTDMRAFGSHVQWGRKTDGHELIRWTGLNDKYIGSDTAMRSDNPQTTKYINSHWDWRYTRDNTLWRSESSPNNVCPSGFRVPTYIELDNERATWSSNNSQGAYNSSLKLTLSGMRGENNYLLGAGRFSFYAASTPYGQYVTSLLLHPYYSIVSRRLRVHGLSVRCIEN